jgi:hypothetical protein
MHDMLLTAENTAIVGAYNTIEWDLSAIGGQEGFVADCVLQEIDIATGCVIFEWHNVDHIDLDESYLEVDPEKPDVTLDYFHYNSVAIDADGSLIVCARNTWATYKVDRNSGDVIWRLGGKRSDFELADGAEYAWQHDARPLGGNLLSFFDNGPNNGESRGLILELDTDRMTASVDREFRHSEKISAGSQGSLQILPNGNVLVGWGSEPLLTEFTADGEPILDVRFPGEKQSYRARRFEWVGRPSDVPHLRAETGSGGNVTVYASWNGATEVAAWRVLAGAAENDLTAVGEPSPRTGFETRIAVTSDARFFAVEAIDAQGESLGISRPEEARESSS